MDFWLFGGGVFLTQEEAEASPQWDGRPAYPALHVREVVEGESQPSEPVQQKPVAWMAFDACTAAPIFSDTPPDDVNLAGWEPLYRHPQPDHAAALADALEELLLAWENIGGNLACDKAQDKLSAYRASQKGGA